MLNNDLSSGLIAGLLFDGKKAGNNPRHGSFAPCALTLSIFEYKMKFITNALILTFIPCMIMAEETTSINRESIHIVPDGETAVKIAEAVSIARYSEATVSRYLPYKAKLENDIWYISGTPIDSAERGGGFPLVQISRIDGKIIHISLSR